MSLGGIETLVTRPAATTHAIISAAEREGLGITEGLVRVAVGVEDTADLLEDFEQVIRRGWGVLLGFRVEIKP